MNVTQHSVRLDNGETLDLQLVKADGFGGDKCAFIVVSGDHDRLYLASSSCSPVDLSTGQQYWVAVGYPVFRDETHYCAQQWLDHIDNVRPHITHISLGMPRDSASVPEQMLEVAHRCVWP